MSPLGRYSEGVAAIVSLALVTVWLVIMLLGGSPLDDLKDAVLIALGYIFGAKGAQAAEGVARAAVDRAKTSSNDPHAQE
jgi:hypothetical protein